MSAKIYQIVAVASITLLAACATRTINSVPAPTTGPSVGATSKAHRDPAAVKKLRPVDLAAIQTKLFSFQKLEKIFAAGPQTKFKAESIPPLMDQVKTDPKYSNLAIAYTQETYRSLGVDDPFEWMQQNPDHMGAINRYIDPQDEGEPIWSTTNRKLRDELPLSPDEEQFTTALVSAMRDLPLVKGIVFRGAKLERDDLERYKDGASVTEAAFTSTSIDPQIALLFTQQNPKPDRVAVIFVIKAKNGSPISAFHPGNNHEVEVLLRPGTPLHVHRKLWTRDRKSVFIFMTE